MKISVVICVKDRENEIERCINSVIKNKPKEIILIDGESKDNTVEIAKKYTNKIFSDKGKGLAYARQLGAEKSSGEYVAYVDSDTELPNEHVLSDMLRELVKNDWVAIHAQLIDPRDNKSYWEQGEDFHWRNRLNRIGEVKSFGTIVCVIKKEIILKYKFDYFFKGAAEDGDFYYRISNAGYKLGISSIVAYHYHRSSLSNFILQRIWYGRGNAKRILKYKKITYSLYALLAPLCIFIYGSGLCISHLKLKFIFYYLVWGLSLLLGTIEGLIKYRKDH